MNLSSFNYFQEFQLNRKTLSVPDLDLPTETDQWVLAMSAATLVVDWSTSQNDPTNQFTPPAVRVLGDGDRRSRGFRPSPDDSSSALR
jgi:hypothetical protein